MSAAVADEPTTRRGNRRMAKKAQGGGQRGRPRRKGTPLNIRLKPGLKEALDAYVRSTRPETTATAIVEMLLEDFLAEKGAWPVTGGEGEAK